MSNKLQLTKAQKIWLQEIHKLGNDFFPSSARVILRKKLGKDFSAEKIPHVCFYDPKHLSLIGIREINPNSQILKDADSVIRCLKKHIESGKYPIPKLQTKDIKEQVGVGDIDIIKILDLIERIDLRIHQKPGFDWKENKPYSEQINTVSFSMEDREYQSIDDLGRDAHYLDSFLEYEDLDTSMDKWLGRFGGQPNTYPQSIFLQQKEKSQETEPVKENTAFIMMRINKDDIETNAVKEAIKETCGRFGIEASTVDEIEHQEKITDVITKEIKACKYLIADITGSRPNVYYEIGYAHALEKVPGVVLLKHKKEESHFDIGQHKTSEYNNLQELKTILSERLEYITGKKPSSDDKTTTK